MFRLLQVTVALLIIPMMCLGMMIGLSGGSIEASRERIAETLLMVPPVAGIAALVASFILWRLDWSRLAYAALIAPLLIWVGLLIWAQQETGFFF